MLINLVRLGMVDEANKLTNSLNGYLNVYKNHMMTAVRAIDFFNNYKEGKIATNKVAKLMYKINEIVKFILSDFIDYGFLNITLLEGAIVAVILSILFTIIQILKI